MFEFLRSVAMVCQETSAMADRKKLVQTLRRGARTHNVELVPDNAARDKVKAMAEALLACDELVEVEREQMEQAWATYRDSWPNWMLGGDDEAPPDAAEGETFEKGWPALFFIGFYKR